MKPKLQDIFSELKSCPGKAFLCPNGCYFINLWTGVTKELGTIYELEDGKHKETYGQDVIFCCPTGNLDFKEGNKEPIYTKTVKFRDLENIKRSFEFLQECVEDYITLPF